MENKNLESLSFEELCTMVEAGTISWSNFVKAQPEAYPGYEEWLEAWGMEENDDHARTFMSLIEKECEGDGNGLVETVTGQMNVVRKTLSPLE